MSESNGATVKAPTLKQLEKKLEKLNARQMKQKEDLRQTTEQLKAVKDQVREAKAAAKAASAKTDEAE